MYRQRSAAPRRNAPYVELRHTGRTAKRTFGGEAHVRRPAVAAHYHLSRSGHQLEPLAGSRNLDARSPSSTVVLDLTAARPLERSTMAAW
jgi:hypothetical protein